jgi:GAF domain-containing protein
MLKSLFSPPVFADDPEKTRDARLLQQIIVTSLVIPMLAIIINLISPTLPFVIPSNILFLTILIALFFLNRFGHVKLTSIIIVSGLVILSTFFNYLNGGEIRPFLLITVLPILMSGLLLGVQAPVIVGAFLVLQYVVMALLRTNGLIAPQAETTFTENLIVVVIGYVLITLIYQFTISRSQLALEQARESEKSLQSTNNELQKIGTSLEQRVGERTRELEKQQQNAEKRSRQFEAIIRISKAINTAKNLHETLPQITRLISDQFGFYHVGVFLNDSANQYAILSAANSEGGQKMLRRGHQLKIGEQGIVGYVTGTGNPRIALDVGFDTVYFNNPDLPLTHSEMALPLRSGAEVIGALDIQSVEQNAFTQEDIEVLEALADQVSLAIQNTRLFDQTNRLLSEAEAIQKQYQKDIWGRLSREQKLSGYKYTITGTTMIEDNELENFSDASAKREVAVPISLRGENIGTLIVQVPLNERVNSDQMDLIRAVAERVALSAENARLFEETNRRAEREQIISDISAKISTSVRTENILKTTAQELNQILDGAEVMIKLGIDRNQ